MTLAPGVHELRQEGLVWIVVAKALIVGRVLQDILRRLTI